MINLLGKIENNDIDMKIKLELFCEKLEIITLSVENIYHSD